MPDAETKSPDLCLYVALRKEVKTFGRTGRSQEMRDEDKDKAANSVSSGCLRASREKRVSVPAAYRLSWSCFVDDGLTRGLVQMVQSQEERWVVRNEL